MFHKGMTGRTEENGPASVKNDIGKRGGQDLYLRDYITRKQESDALFTGESMTTTPTLREAAQQALEALDLHAEGGRLVLEPAPENLEDLVARITPENRHVLAFDGAAEGGAA